VSRRDKERKPNRNDLPTGDLRGRFFVTEDALRGLERILPTYRGADGDHEGIGFLCGFETERGTILTTTIAPEADHGRGHVRCRDDQVGDAIRIANRLGLGLIAQVHSHPSGGTGHSYGDDDMVFMPFEGMLSIVVPHYAHYGLRPIDSLGVHQFQDGRWRLMSRDSVREAILLIPSEIDLR
jgi:proteasome lid subunit RPN8/RPN11